MTLKEITKRYNEGSIFENGLDSALGRHGHKREWDKLPKKIRGLGLAA